MGVKLAAVMFILMIAMAGAGSWYYKQTQARITILTENNAKLEVAVQTSEASGMDKSNSGNPDFSI